MNRSGVRNRKKVCVYSKQNNSSRIIVKSHQNGACWRELCVKMNIQVPGKQFGVSGRCNSGPTVSKVMKLAMFKSK